VDANAVAGALISKGIGKEATNVVAADATVPAKTIRASLFSDTSISSTKQNSPPKTAAQFAQKKDSTDKQQLKRYNRNPVYGVKKYLKGATKLILLEATNDV
jgi:hypothetical protein